MTDLRDELQAALGNSYRVEREIGGGGMSRLFLAWETTLERRVVIKILPPELAGTVSIERFKREIMLAARLQHPHLVQVLSAGEFNGLPYLTMPYVDGETLRTRLGRTGQLPIAEGVRVLREIASALDCAHELSIVHRDIKPENVLITRGSAMVTDFGVAKAISASAEQDETITALGLALGTPAYMAPEQASASSTLDARADIYAFGVLAYELFAGQPPFTGRSAQALLSAHALETPTPIDIRRPSVPLQLTSLIMRCLAKDPADRPQTAADLVGELDAMTTPTAGTRSFIPESSFSRIRRHPIATAAIAAVVFGAGLTAWRVTSAPDSSIPAHTRTSIVVADSVRLRPDLGHVTISLSPDGNRLLYAGGVAPQRLYIRSLDNGTVQPVPGTDSGRNPQFSPDGKSITFVSRGALKQVPADGGQVISLLDSVTRYAFASNGAIIYDKITVARADRGLWVKDAGGRVARLTTVDTMHERLHSFPSVLPDGKTVLFQVQRNPVDSSELAAIRIGDRALVRLGVKGTNPRYVSSGHIVFGRQNGQLYAVAFDVRHLRVTGPILSVIDDAVAKPGGAMEVAISDRGTLVYLQPTNSRRLELVDRDGRALPLRYPPRGYLAPRLSPDGSRFAVAVKDRETTDIWIGDVNGDVLTRFTTDGRASSPEWTGDGKRIYWRSAAAKATVWQRADGSGVPETLLPFADPALVAPNGLFAILGHSGGDRFGVQIISMDSARPARRLSTGALNPRLAFVSPDNQWVAYLALVGNGSELFVQSLNAGGGVHQVTNGGATQPSWGGSSRELIYRANGRFMRAIVATSPEFGIVRRDTLFTDVYWSRPNGAQTPEYDVSRDGKQFLVLSAAGEPAQAIVVFGWLDELRARMKHDAKP